MDPLTKGEYPTSMRHLVGNRLPRFSKEEAKQLKGSFDFLGLNHYSTVYASNAPDLRGSKPSLLNDPLVNYTSNYQVFYTSAPVALFILNFQTRKY